MKIEILNRLIDKKKIMLINKLDEYKKLTSMAVNSARDSGDYENIATQSMRYSIILAKLESEIQQLEELKIYINS